MGAALVLMLVGFGALAGGVLIGRYYVPDDRQLRRTARHGRAYMRALSHLIARDHDTVVSELRGVVEENIDDVEPYFALGAMFRSKGEHERAIRIHQALAVRERDKKKLRQRAMFELGLDFRAAGMPRRATRALEEVLLEEPSHEPALRTLASLYEEQARFSDAAGLWARLGKRRNEDTSQREHHLLCAAAQTALGRADADSAKHLLKAAQREHESAHFFAAAAELAAMRGNHRGARDRLKQALIEEPALVPHLLPGLIAAEQGLSKLSRPSIQLAAEDELAEDRDPPPEVAQLAAASDVTPPVDAQMTAAVPDAMTAATSGAMTAATSGVMTAASSGAMPAATAHGVPLVPVRPVPSIAERVLELLAEVEAQTGPRIELSLIRAQLLSRADDKTDHELVTRFPDSLSARVASARQALKGGDAAKVRGALEVLVSDHGALAWTLRGRWQCSHCGKRPGPFSWRCGQCRRWNTLRMETGVEPPPVPPRERRSMPRVPRPEALLGAAPDEALPVPTLDPGLSSDELIHAGSRRSLLDRVGGWFGALRRDR
jgi:lipopolysaccharide biosynthesis regulator YciM